MKALSPNSADRPCFNRQDTIMVVDYKGPSPHDLGTAEIATVRVVNGNIEVALHIVDDWHRPGAQIVQVRMAPSVARSLAERLAVTAADAPG
jgi:hypothetical protein